MADLESHVRWAAIQSLWCVGKEKVLALIEKALADKDGSVRVEAAATLGCLGGEKALALLETALEDKDRHSPRKGDTPSPLPVAAPLLRLSTDMTRDEFIAQQTAAERQIRRQVIPFGVLYAVFFAMICAIACLAVLLCFYFTTPARTPILYELGSCFVLFELGILAERDGRRRFEKLGVKCPSCHRFLMFTLGEKTAETGRCSHCGEKVFD
ncbi:MAG TPA: HEAT repeat domain-containing protein [Planctomycetota bacterium]